MAHTLTVELPELLFHALDEKAREQGTTVEGLVQSTLEREYSPLDWDYGEFTEEERRAVWQRALEREDLWGSEEDKVWDTWTPSNPAALSS